MSARPQPESISAEAVIVVIKENARRRIGGH
jgi:hypothetical protein